MPTSKTRKRRRAAAPRRTEPPEAAQPAVAAGSKRAGASRSSVPVAEIGPWSRRSVLVMVALVALLQLPLGFLTFLQHRSSDLLTDIVLVPVNFPPLPLLLACLVAMPLARRLAGESRSMAFLETIAVGVTIMVIDLTLIVTAFAAPANHTSQPAAPGAGPRSSLPTPLTALPPASGTPAVSSSAPAARASPAPRPTPAAPQSPSPVEPLTTAQVASFAFSNIVALLTTAYVFPIVYRLLWMRGRGLRSSRR